MRLNQKIKVKQKESVCPEIPYVCFLFRRPNKSFFSIEKVFGLISSYLGEDKKILVSYAYAPHFSTSILNVLRNILFLRREKADIYHITGDIHYSVFAFKKRKIILTIHDCIFLHNSSGIKRALFKYLYLKWPISHSSVVTTISESTKEEIIRYTACKPDKIVVIGNPISKLFYFKEKVFNSNNPLILFVGVTKNKNLDRVSESLSGIKCRLRIIGVLNSEQLERLNKFRISYETISGLTDEEIVNEYLNADFVLFPSLYEGFGLPILEGQKAGRPVITSNLSPMVEVSGGAACFVDPEDVNSIKSGVLRIITDENYRNDLVSSGFANVAKYSLDEISHQYSLLYKKMMHSNFQH